MRDHSFCFRPVDVWTLGDKVFDGCRAAEQPNGTFLNVFLDLDFLDGI